MDKPDNTHHEYNFMVRITTPDIAFTEPLREYLETHNYLVSVNNEHIKKSLYHIIYGDIQFVKNILEALKNIPERRLLLLQNFDNKDVSLLPLHDTDKIVFHMPISLSSRDVSDVFQFFFTAKIPYLDFKNKNFPYNPAANAIQRISPDDDKIRINEMLGKIFSENDKQNVNKKKSGQVPSLFHFVLFRRLILFSVGCIAALVILSLLSIGISGLGLYISANQLVAGKLKSASLVLNLTSLSTGIQKTTFFLVSPLLQNFGLYSFTRDTERFDSIYSHSIVSMKSSLSLYAYSQELSRNLFSLDSKSVSEDRLSLPVGLQQMLADISFIKTNISLASAELRSLEVDKTFPFNFPIIKSLEYKTSVRFTDVLHDIGEAEKLLNVYAKISGFTGERLYLVLLQNSAELRPTGGFIGSVGLMKFRDGRLVSFTVQDVYDVDGQLKGHVDPPPLVNAFLGQEHWYLRDSNWDPDFTVSGGKAAWFYDKSLGIPVDGVMAVNTLFLTDLLGVLGPVDLPDYHDRITADNFFGKSLYYTQSDFFPGSTQKKDFLGTLARTIMGKFQSGSGINGAHLIRLLDKGLTEKNVLIYLNDQTANSLIREYGWGGELASEWGCNLEQVQNMACLSDYNSDFDTNLSISKVNNFIRKEESRTVDIDESGAVTESVSLTYENTSKDGEEGGGGYTPYVRIYVPADAVIQSVLLDGKRLSFNDGKQNYRIIPYYMLSEERNMFSVLGLVFEVKPLSKAQVYVTYKRGSTFQFKNGIGSYELLIQKQPGQKGVPLALSVLYPNHWKADQEKTPGRNTVNTIVGTQTFLAKVGKLEYNDVLTRDIRIKIYFSN